ncbi:MAG: heme exporter protein CcmD [Pseudomonadota bacterium]
MAFSDPHTPFILAAYGASALILAGLIWASVHTSRRARVELERMEKERGR